MRRFLAGLLAALTVLSLCACGAADAPAKTDGQTASVSWDELVFDRTMSLRYAEQFTVEYAGESYKRITINNDRVYLLVAEGAAVPEGIPSGVHCFAAAAGPDLSGGSRRHGLLRQAERHRLHHPQR